MIQWFQGIVFSFPSNVIRKFTRAKYINDVLGTSDITVEPSTGCSVTDNGGNQVLV